MINDYELDDLNIYPEAIDPKETRQSTKYLATPYEGLVRGNMFNELYTPYKNYKQRRLTANNEKGQMLLDIRMYNQALIDLNLYLDLHPSDTNTINLRADYLTKYNEAIEKFERKYGPITLDSEYTKKSPWAWDNKNFPWEVRD